GIMVKRVRVAVADDIDGTDGAETVTFAVDGQAWEIDLAKENRDKFTRDLAPFVRAGRPASASVRHSPTLADSRQSDLDLPVPDLPSHTPRSQRTPLRPGTIPPVMDDPRSTKTDIYDVADRLWETA